MGEDHAMRLIAYRIHKYKGMPIVPASALRDWMSATEDRFAYRCLPLTIANQHGWFILNTHRIRVVWNGRNDKEALKIIVKGGPKDVPAPATSHFGHGVLTFNINYLIRTAPGYNLWARGPSNWPKDGIVPLEGIVETDWSVATFTMNWKMTTVDVPVEFEVGEPICMISPVKRGEVETFGPEVLELDSDPALKEKYEKWSRSRSDFNRQLGIPGSPAQQEAWQKEYLQGRGPDDLKAPEHQSRLFLKEFEGIDRVT